MVGACMITLEAPIAKVKCIRRKQEASTNIIIANPTSITWRESL